MGGVRRSQYSIENGSYYLKEEALSKLTGPRIRLMCDQVGVAYAMLGDTSVLLKHGDYKDTAIYAKNNKVNHIRFPRGFPVEELNKLISNSGYLDFLLKDIANGKYDHLGTEFDTLC